jgi:protein O-GlcNAc transferase
MKDDSPARAVVRSVEALLAAGHLSEALAAVQRATQRWKKDASLWALQAQALRLMGNAAAAEVAAERAVRLAPDDAAMAQLLGEIAIDLDAYDKAIDALARAVALTPSGMAHARLGIALQGAQRYAEAVEVYRKVLPDAGEHLAYTIHLNLGTCLHQQHDYLGAAEHAGSALQHVPDDPVAWQNAGSAWLEAGEAKRALDAFKRSSRPQAASAYLYALNFVSPYDPLAVCEAHRRWGRRTTSALPPQSPVPPSPTARGRTRVGFVSGDFRQHPVAFFLRPLLAALDRSRFEIVLYSDVRSPDAMTADFKQQADRWVSLVGASDEQIAAFIRSDSPDVMIDLGSHTGERAALFAHRMSPLQLSYLGYANTTGLPTIDAVLTDELLDPPGLTDPHYVEPLLRLGRCAYPYQPPEAAPEVAPSPVGSNDALTFASFNRPYKIDSATIALWARVLSALPDSRLLMVGKGFDRAAGRARLAALFDAAGIGAERLVWRGATDFASYLALHSEVDVALDCQPWSGHTVTLHAAWMGVPTLCLEATHHAGRFSAACMRSLGCEAMICGNADAFVARAVALAADPPGLSVLRASLRSRLSTSALCDYAGLATRFMAAVEGFAKK